MSSGWTWDTTAGVGSAIGALGAFATAFVALKSAKMSARATAELAQVEADRRQGELTPEFEFKLTEGYNGIDDRGELVVRLVGPAELDYLDEVTVSILNEAWKEHWTGRLPPGVTQEEADRFVWGPWEFDTAARVQIADERTAHPYEYSRLTGKVEQRLTLVRTRPGRWMTGTTPDAWRQEQPGPLRLRLVCRRAPYNPWSLIHELECEPPTGSTIH